MKFLRLKLRRFHSDAIGPGRQQRQCEATIFRDGSGTVVRELKLSVFDGGVRDGTAVENVHNGAGDQSVRGLCTRGEDERTPDDDFPGCLVDDRRPQWVFSHSLRLEELVTTALQL